MNDTEIESFETFSKIVPKNEYEWEGSIVLYSPQSMMFYNIAFGCGGNLDEYDLDEGYDDYIMVGCYSVQEGSGVGLNDIIVTAQDNGYVDEDTIGLAEVNSGELLLKRKEWQDGDIRRFMVEAIDFVSGYDKSDKFIYLASDN